MSVGKSFTAVECLAMVKICNILQQATASLPHASFWARSLGMTEMEEELIEVQDALMAHKKAILAAIKTCPSSPATREVNALLRAIDDQEA